MIKTIYAHLLYFIAMQLRVQASVDELKCLAKKRPPLTSFQRWRQRKSDSLLIISNRIIDEERQRRHLQDAYENSVQLLMRGVSYNPERKEPGA